MPQDAFAPIPSPAFVKNSYNYVHLFRQFLTASFSFVYPICPLFTSRSPAKAIRSKSKSTSKDNIKMQKRSFRSRQPPISENEPHVQKPRFTAPGTNLEHADDHHHGLRPFFTCNQLQALGQLYRQAPRIHRRGLPRSQTSFNVFALAGRASGAEAETWTDGGGRVSLPRLLGGGFPCISLCRYKASCCCSVCRRHMFGGGRLSFPFLIVFVFSPSLSSSHSFWHVDFHLRLHLHLHVPFHLHLHPRHGHPLLLFFFSVFIFLAFVSRSFFFFFSSFFFFGVFFCLFFSLGS